MMALARDLVGDRPELPPIEPAAREGRLPLSFAQERLWFIDRLEPGSAVYNLSVAWRLGGALDEAALSTMPEFEAEQQAASNPVAGA